jgi:hypothetical protein
LHLQCCLTLQLTGSCKKLLPNVLFRTTVWASILENIKLLTLTKLMTLLFLPIMQTICDFYKVVSVAAILGLQLNPSKCKVMNTCAHPKCIVIQDVEITNVNNFRYLWAVSILQITRVYKKFVAECVLHRIPSRNCISAYSREMI